MPSLGSLLFDFLSGRGEYDHSDRNRPGQYGGHSPRRRPEPWDPYTDSDRYGYDDGYNGRESENFDEERYLDSVESSHGEAWEPYYVEERYPLEYDAGHLHEHGGGRRQRDMDNYYRTEERLPMSLGSRSRQHSLGLGSSRDTASTTFGEYRELRSSGLRNRTAALSLLQRVASLLTPTMQRRGWYVPLLEEILPEQGDSLHGYHKLDETVSPRVSIKICVRLRSHRDPVHQFMEFEEIVDTVVHELAHFVHAHHNRNFRALWNELRDEYEELYPRARRLPRVDN